jgi:hypothetical protein
MGTFTVIISELFLQFLSKISSFWISLFDLLLTGRLPQHTTLVRMLTIYLEMLVPLQYIINIKNTIQLMNDLPDIPFDQDLKFFSFDLTNMYSNIPITELIKIIKIMCKQKDLNIEIKKEIMKKCHILTKENYF